MVQPPTVRMDTDLKDFYLEQYRQAHESFRHWDQMAWTMMGLVSAAALGILAWVFQDNSIHGGNLLALGLASIFTVLSFRIMFKKMSSLQDKQARPLIRHLEDRFQVHVGSAEVVHFGVSLHHSIEEHDDIDTPVFIINIWQHLCRLGKVGWKCRENGCRGLLQEMWLQKAHLFGVRAQLWFLVVGYTGVWIWLICTSYNDC